MDITLTLPDDLAGLDETGLRTWGPPATGVWESVV